LGFETPVFYTVRRTAIAMDPFRLRGLVVAIIAMVLASLSYAAISASLPYGITSAIADAIGLSLIVVPVIFFGALATGGFPFREYQEKKGIGGILADGAIIFAVCLLATGLTARTVGLLGLDSTGRLIVLGGVGYLTGFGVFSARNLEFYDPRR
jgi:hypothetical protein